MADFISPVKNEAVGSTRALTPSSVIVKSNRIVTAPRSNSAPKGKINNLTRAVHDAQNANMFEAKCVSQRKQRQWRNNNLMGLPQFINIFLESRHELDNSERENPEQMLNSSSFVLDYKSPIGQLLEDEEKETLELFRSCKDEYLLPRSYFKSFKNISANLQMNTCEKAWINIEKKLRVTSLAAMMKDSQYIIFIGAVELLLLSFVKTFAITNDIVQSMDPFISSPIIIDVNRKSLAICVKDSSLLRLLLHTACQFYGLKSKSDTNQRTKSRETKIRIPLKLSQTIEESASLHQYLTRRLSLDSTSCFTNPQHAE